MTRATMHAKAKLPDVTEDNFPYVLAAMRAQFRGASANQLLFQTRVANLFDNFLTNLPPDMRAHYKCRSCRQFFERFGGLVTIDEDGRQTSALWNSATAPIPFGDAVERVAQLVKTAAIENVFLSEDATWGTPHNVSVGHGRTWTHFSILTPPVFETTPLKTAYQVMAEKREDHDMLWRGIRDFPFPTVQKAHQFLTSGQLFRAEKHLEVATWLLELHKRLRSARNSLCRDALVWRAAASAPSGFCHVRQSMIGTLLEDVKAGRSFSGLKARFDAKMDPTKYMRPSAEPSEGNIVQAEKVIAALQAQGSLERRFALLSDLLPLQVHWRAPEAQKTSGKESVFAHLRKKPTTEITDMPATKMTCVKFLLTVLPHAAALEFFVPHNNSTYAAFVTAKNPAAPPILQWDDPKSRNPLNWYQFKNGSPAVQWNLGAGGLVTVTCVANQPNMPTMLRHGEGVLFALSGCYDVLNNGGLALFPEILKGEYHGVRSTIEAHSRRGKIEDAKEAEVCGVLLQAGPDTYVAGYRFRVTVNNLRTVYVIDRWD